MASTAGAPRIPEGRTRRYQYVRRIYRPFVQRYVALSRHLADYLEREVGVPPRSHFANLQWRGHGAAFPAPLRARSLSRLPVRRSGRVARRLGGPHGRGKGSARPCARLSRVRASFRPQAAKHMRLVLVGDGAEREALAEHRSIGSGARDHVWFAGRARPTSRTSCAAWTASCCRRRARACRTRSSKPWRPAFRSIATDVGGNAGADRVGHERTARCRRATARRWPRRCWVTSASRSLARRHAKAARRVAESRFSLKRMVADYSALYEHSLAAAGIPPAARNRSPHCRARMCGIIGIMDTQGEARDPARAPLAHERDPAPPRSGRRRAAFRAGPRPRPPAPVDHRPLHRAAAALQRGRQRRRRLQRRDLQLPGADPRACAARARLPHEERHRGHRARLGAVGRSLRDSASAACSPSRCGTATARRSSSRATGSA